jgi:hypothetical protein
LAALCVTEITSYGVIYDAFPILAAQIAAATGSYPALFAILAATAAGGAVLAAIAPPPPGSGRPAAVVLAAADGPGEQAREQGR